MRARGLILIDTKYEFGLDRDGVFHVIDKVNFPDSSRLCDVEEWEEKYSRVATAMATGRCSKSKNSPKNTFEMRCWIWLTVQRRTQRGRSCPRTRKDLRPPLWGSNPGHSGLQANQNLTQVKEIFFGNLRYSIDISVAPGSSDDGVPAAPSRFFKMQDGVSPSPTPEGWFENLTEDWLVRCTSQSCNSACEPSSRPSFAGEQ